MKLVCARCGRVGTKADMTHSKTTGSSYCWDVKACEARALRKSAKERRFHKTKGVT